MMRAISLFAGIGGIDLGLAPYARTVCYVENDPYCVAVLRARQRDGRLDDAPIWDDVRTFDGRPWRGCVDLITGGFPCQPFSTAARGRNNAQDLWPEMLRIISQVRPRFVFAENVKREPIDRSAHDLARAGYVVRCLRSSAASVGASFRGHRCWMVASLDDESQRPVSVDDEMAKLPCFEAVPPRLGEPDGLSQRMARALGNAVVPAQARRAWEILSQLT